MMLNMGQWLSIPFVLAGIYFVWRAMRLGKRNEEDLIFDFQLLIF